MAGLLEYLMTPEGQVLVSVWGTGLVTGAFIVLAYFFTWGDTFVKAYLKTHFSKGKKQFGILFESTAGYFRMRIIDFKEDLLNGKYQRDETRIRHIQSNRFPATVPFALADVSNNLLVDLTPRDKILGKEVSADALQLGAERYIELKTREAQMDLNKFIRLMLIVIAGLCVLGLVLGALNFDAVGKIKSAAEFTASWASNASYYASHTINNAVNPVIH